MYTYFGCCVDLDGQEISEMVENSKDITYRTFRKHVDKSELDSVFPFYNDIPGLSIANDWGVSFAKSKFNGEPCVYVYHSAVEYVFK